MEGDHLIPVLFICSLCHSPVFKGGHNAAVEAADERTRIEVAEHEQEVANRRRDGGGGGDGSCGKGREVEVDTAVKEVERDGCKKKGNNNQPLVWKGWWDSHLYAGCCKNVYIL